MQEHFLLVLHALRLHRPVNAGLDVQLEVQQQSASTDRKAMEERLAKAHSEASALRSQGERAISALRARETVHALPLPRDSSGDISVSVQDYNNHLPPSGSRAAKIQLKSEQAKGMSFGWNESVASFLPRFCCWGMCMQGQGGKTRWCAGA